VTLYAPIGHTDFPGAELILADTRTLPIFKARAMAAIASGRLRLSELAYEKGLTSPIGGAMDFTSGKELQADALRCAAVIGVALPEIREWPRAA